MYSAGFFHTGSSPQTSNTSGVNPISISLSSPMLVNSLYPGQAFQVVSKIDNNANHPITVSIIPYGCPTISQSRIYRTIPANSPLVLDWNFSAPSSGSCLIQFTSCFNYTSHARYPITVESNEYTGKVPTVSPSFSVSPLTLSIQNFSSTVVAPPISLDPQGVNQTMYILSTNAGSGSITNSELSWLDLYVSGSAYVLLPSGYSSIHGNSLNLTAASALSSLADSGNFILPFYLTIPAVQSQSSYSFLNINITAGYNYCMQSQQLPVSTR